MTRFEAIQSNVGAQGLAPDQSLNLAVDIDAAEVKRRLVQCMKVALDNARGLAKA